MSIHDRIQKYIVQPTDLNFLGALIGALGSLGGLFGGGDQSAQIAASVQNNKLNNATQLAQNAENNAQNAVGKQLDSLIESDKLQQAALQSIVQNFRAALLRNLQG